MTVYEDDLYQYIVTSEEKSTKLARIVSQKDFDLAKTFVRNGISKIPAVKTIRELNDLTLSEATYAYNAARIAYDQTNTEQPYTGPGNFKPSLTLVYDKVQEDAPVPTTGESPLGDYKGYPVFEIKPKDDYLFRNHAVEIPAGVDHPEGRDIYKKEEVRWIYVRKEAGAWTFAGWDVKACAENHFDKIDSTPAKKSSLIPSEDTYQGYSVFEIKRNGDNDSWTKATHAIEVEKGQIFDGRKQSRDVWFYLNKTNSGFSREGFDAKDYCEKNWTKVATQPKKSNHCPNYHRPLVGEKFIWGETQLKHGDVLKDKDGSLHTYNAHRCHTQSGNDTGAWFKNEQGKDCNRLVTFSGGQTWPALVGATIYSLAKPKRLVKVGDTFKNGDKLVPGDVLRTKYAGDLTVEHAGAWASVTGKVAIVLTTNDGDLKGYALDGATYLKLGK